MSLERIKIAEFPIDLVLNNVFCIKKTFIHDNKEYVVRMNSQRYFMFRENLFCVCCSLKGTKMFLEHYIADMTPHFNLYGEKDDQLILMTKDHIVAKALGGQDKHSNYQTMCSVCNNLKGHSCLTLDSLKKLRRIFDENKNSLPKKKLNLLLEKEKNRLDKFKKYKKPAPSKYDCILNTDLNCYKSKESIIGVSVYDPPIKNKDKIGCIKRGTILKPVVEYKNKIFCDLNNELLLEIKKSYMNAK